MIILGKRFVIRSEKPSDYLKAEWVAEQSFYNVFRPGCLEHLLLHKLRSDVTYLPSLSFLATLDGEVVGGVACAESRLVSGGKTFPVITLGPLFVLPRYQKCGIGGLLLQKVIEEAKKTNYPGIFLFGHPTYYPRFGFVDCSSFHITTAEGENFPAFMALPLRKGSLENRAGRYVESPVYASVTATEADAYDRNFPFLEKKKQPGQFTS